MPSARRSFEHVVDNSRSVLLAGTSTLFADGYRGQFGQVTLTGASDLFASGVLGHSSSVTLAGGSSLSAAGTRQLFAGAALAGSSSLAADGTLTQGETTVQLSGSSSLNAVGARGHNASAALTGGSSLTAAGTRRLFAGATLAGSGSLVAGGTVGRFGSVTLAGGSSLFADGTVTSGSSSVLDTLTAAYQFESGALLTDYFGGTSLSNVNSVTSTAGKSGNAATFGGNAQGINTALTRTFSYTAGAFSVSLWAYRASTGTNFALLDLDAQNRIFQRNTGDFVFRASNTDLTVAGNTYWPAATWTHFAFVFSGSNHLLYIDGTLRGTAAGGGGGGSATAYIGNLSGGSWVLNGQIDELYFANGTAWDAGQVAELYNSGTGLFL